jgi:hypothetical protein
MLLKRNVACKFKKIEKLKVCVEIIFKEKQQQTFDEKKKKKCLIFI